MPVLITDASERDLEWIAKARPYLDFLARTESITVLDDAAHAPESAIALVGEMKVLIPMAGLVDKEAELKQLDNEIEHLSGDVKRTKGKLANPAFVDPGRGHVTGVSSALGFGLDPCHGAQGESRFHQPCVTGFSWLIRAGTARLRMPLLPWLVRAELPRAPRIAPTVTTGQQRTSDELRQQPAGATLSFPQVPCSVEGLTTEIAIVWTPG